MRGITEYISPPKQKEWLISKSCKVTETTQGLYANLEYVTLSGAKSLVIEF